MTYEAVHPIASWSDLRNRLDTDRRCYAFFHPRLPERAADLRRDRAPEGRARERADAARRERAGARPARRRHRRVLFDLEHAEGAARHQLRQPAPEARHRGPAGATCRGSRCSRRCRRCPASAAGWTRAVSEQPLAAARRGGREVCRHDRPSGPGHGAAPTRSRARIGTRIRGSPRRCGTCWRSSARATSCARSRAGIRSTTSHSSTSATARTWTASSGCADTSARGLDQSYGMMVSYRYDLDEVERNHERFLASGRVAASGRVSRLLD